VQQGLIAGAQKRIGFNSGKYCVDLVFFERFNHFVYGLFRTDCADTFTNHNERWILKCKETKERLDCSESLIARCDRVSTFIFKVVEEVEDEVVSKVEQVELIDGNLEMIARISDQEFDAIAVAADGVLWVPLLVDQVVSEEGDDKCAQCCHRFTLLCHSRQ